MPTPQKRSRAKCFRRITLPILTTTREADVVIIAILQRRNLRHRVVPEATQERTVIFLSRSVLIPKVEIVRTILLFVMKIK